MQLLNIGPSPFGRKVLIAAAEVGLLDEIEIVNCDMHPVSPDPAVAAANPLGKLPVLILDSGAALYDSRVITAHLDELSGGRLIPASGPRRWAAMCTEAAADGMADAAVLARFEQMLRPESLRWADWLRGQEDKIKRTLDMLEATDLKASGTVTLAEIAVAGALTYVDYRFEYLEWRTTRPRLAAFAAAFAERPSFVAAKEKALS